MRRADATRLYYALQILLSMPTWVVMAVYLVQELNLSPLQLVLMGTAMEGRCSCSRSRPASSPTRTAAGCR